MTGKRLLTIALVTIMAGFGLRFYMQQQTANTTRGQVITYYLDAEGTANVTISDRFIFTKPESDAAWKVAFPPAHAVTMNEFSTLTIVLPTGTKLTSVDPKPDETTDGALTWRGPREMTWPA
ncbi:MAG: hypothetical protein ACYC3S_13900 [Chloroflexota bacterium]